MRDLVRRHLKTFLAEADARAVDGRALPRYVRGAFERLLDCGVLSKGFVRVWCPECNISKCVGFS